MGGIGQIPCRPPVAGVLWRVGVIVGLDVQFLMAGGIG